MPTTRLSIVMTNVSGRGGISQNTYCLATALSEHPLDLTYVTTSDYELNSHPHPFPVTNAFEPLHTKKTVLSKSLAHINNLRRLKTQLDHLRPDIWHLHEVKIAALDLALVRRCQRNATKVVYTAHDVLHPERLSTSGAHRKFYNTVDAIIANADENKQQIQRYFGVSEAKIKVIPFGNNLSYQDNGKHLPAKDKSEARRELGVDAESPILLFFGYVREYKGLEVLLQALVALRQQGEKVNLMIAGESVEDFNKYQKIIDRHQIADRVFTFLRYIPEDQVSNFFWASDLVVLPYHRIYQSGVVHVAYAHSRPVIASSVGGLTEVVVENQSGHLVPPNDPKALADVIRKTLSDPKTLEQMGQFARKMVVAKYTWRSAAEETSALYKQISCHR